MSQNFPLQIATVLECMHHKPIPVIGHLYFDSCVFNINVKDVLVENTEFLPLFIKFLKGKIVRHKEIIFLIY